MHWARKVMNDETAKWVQNLGPANMDALEISGMNWAWVTWKTYQTVDYPSFDICRDIIYDKMYDIVLAEQVLEHVTYPYRAVRNIYRMIREGGYFLVTLPFLVMVHNIPIDCSRWTPTGLIYFLRECGFHPNIKVGSWGNRECINANFVDWVEYQPGVHSLVNEPNFPIVVWALAQRAALPPISPDGSTLLPSTGGVLSTADGLWTFASATASGGNIILLNGQQAANGAAVSLLVAQGGELFACSMGGSWYQWSSSCWWPLQGDPTRQRFSQEATQT